jgi:hypothetical protein
VCTYYVVPLFLWDLPLCRYGFLGGLLGLRGRSSSRDATVLTFCLVCGEGIKQVSRHSGIGGLILFDRNYCSGGLRRGFDRGDRPPYLTDSDQGVFSWTPSSFSLASCLGVRLLNVGEMLKVCCRGYYFVVDVGSWLTIFSSSTSS